MEFELSNFVVKHFMSNVLMLICVCGQQSDSGNNYQSSKRQRCVWRSCYWL